MKKNQSCFFRGGKEEWQEFCETTLARDQKERDPV